MKKTLVALAALVVVSSLSACAHQTRVGGPGNTDYTYTSSPSYNNGSTYHSTSSSAQTTAGKMMAPMTGY